MKKFSHLGLVGWPLEHSFSPALHQAALRSLGIDGQYKLHAIPPFPEGRQLLSAILTDVRQGIIQGLNITIPHKVNIISQLDSLTPAAQTIGAVNTIYMQRGKLNGDNTDAPGFWTDLSRYLGSKKIIQSNALILGAGGSSRAIIFALLSRGWSVTVAARNLAQAAKLCEHFSLPGNSLAAVALQKSEIENLPSSPSLIVNCTPVGMFPKSDHSPWPKDLPLPSKSVVYDLVYNPRQTLLVRQALEEGLTAASGLGMLIEQAALSLEHWLDVKAPRSAMIAHIADI
ncbi:MAG: shikimate dehydrogenase [Anaerolineae bacterium]|nr:shikimate dehydrogenase [Anaerolineae bacterium]